MKKSIILCLLFLFIQVCLFSQEPTAEPAPTCQPAFSISYGYVTDAVTGEPIAGAVIFGESMLGNSESISDADGYYILQLMTCMMGESTEFTVSAAGYETLVVIRGSHAGNNFELLPRGSTPPPTPGPTTPPACLPVIYSAEGYVRDFFSLAPVPGATVTVVSIEGEASTITDENGFYEINIPHCTGIETASFTAVKAGYGSLTETYDVDLVNEIDIYIVPPCWWGDVNEDGSITIVDALLVARCYVSIIPCSDNSCRADVDCDGDIDIIDALLIAQYYVDLIKNFPCGR